MMSNRFAPGESHWGMPITLSQVGKRVVPGQIPLLARAKGTGSLQSRSRPMRWEGPSGTVAEMCWPISRKNPLPEDISYVWGSDIKRQNDSFGALGSVFIDFPPL